MAGTCPPDDLWEATAKTGASVEKNVPLTQAAYAIILW